MKIIGVSISIAIARDIWMYAPDENPLTGN